MYCSRAASRSPASRAFNKLTLRIVVHQLGKTLSRRIKMIKPVFCDSHGPECLGAVIATESTLQGATGELHCRVVVVEFFTSLSCAQGEGAANGQLGIVRDQAL